MVMMIFMLGILLAGVGVFVWLYFSIQKEKISFEENLAVPITDVKEIQSARVPAENPQESVPVETKATVETVTHPEPSYETVRIQAEEPAAAAADSARAEETIRQLNEEILLIREKAVAQAKNAIEVINKLREDNEQLRLEIEKSEEKAAKPTVDEDTLTHLRAENVAFKEQLASVTLEAEELRQKLNQSGQDAGGQSNELKAMVQRLEAENAALRLNVPSSTAPETAGRDVHEQCLRDIALLSSELEALRRDNEKLRAPQPSDDSVGLEQMKREAEDLRARVEELTKLNSSLDENSRYLQYELTKSRAQAAGLERICENSRRQFEDIARGAREAAQDNQALKDQTRVLEQSLTDFKKLNAELLKREKLTQFELEKNLDQIRNLEDIYGVFRTRLARLGISEEDLAKD